MGETEYSVSFMRQGHSGQCDTPKKGFKDQNEK